MAWQQVVPQHFKRNCGVDDALCEVWSSGQLALHVRAWESLGQPNRIRICIDVDEIKLRLAPAGDQDPYAFAINAKDRSNTRRIQLRSVVTRYPVLIGMYEIEREPGVLICTHLPD